MSVYLVFFNNKTGCCCVADSVQSAIEKCKSMSDSDIVKVECVPFQYVE